MAILWEKQCFLYLMMQKNLWETTVKKGNVYAREPK